MDEPVQSHSVWQLDGGRGFRALTRGLRWIALGAILILWALTRQGVLCLLALGAGYRLFVHKDFAPEVDYVALGQFVGLIARAFANGSPYPLSIFLNVRLVQKLSFKRRVQSGVRGFGKYEKAVDYTEHIGFLVLLRPPGYRRSSAG